MVPNLLLSGRTVVLVCLHGDSAAQRQRSHQIAVDTRAGVHRRFPKIHVRDVHRTSTWAGTGNPSGIRGVEQGQAVPVLGGEHSGTVVVYKAGQGIELGLTHLDVVALSEVFHLVNLSYL